MKFLMRYISLQYPNKLLRLYALYIVDFKNIFAVHLFLIKLIWEQLDHLLIKSDNKESNARSKYT